METKKKKEYAAPVTDVVELKTEGVLCGSGDPTPKFGDSWGWD